MQLHVLKDPVSLDLVTIKLQELQLFSFDTETTGLDPWKCKAFMLSFSDGESAWVVPTKYFEPKHLTYCLNKIFCESTKEVVGHNLKFDLHFLKNTFGVTCHRQIHDTCVQGFLLDENRLNGLKPLARSVLGHDTGEEDKIKTWLKANFKKKEDYRYDAVPEEITVPYSGADAWLTYRLHRALQPQVKASFGNLYDTERQVLKILWKMEQNGLKVDVPYLQELQVTYQDRLEAKLKAIWATVGKEFNVDSDDELGEVLYKKLELKCPIYTAKGNPSTAQEALQLLNHPVVDLLMEYRELSHDLSTCIAGPIELADERGYIHCDYSINIAKTGRFSCRRPNNQNIKKDPAIRKAYLVEPGEEAWMPDQSQIEMVGFAHYSKDRKMLQALEDNVDLHQMTAATVYGKPVAEVTKHERAIGKGTNFAIIYGCGNAKLASFINNYTGEQKITSQEATAFKTRYLERFPSVQAFTQKVIYTVKKNRPPFGHHVRNQFGRVRRLDPINKAYTGVNHLIQGWAADLMKAGMVRLEKELHPVWRQNVHDSVRIDRPAEFKSPEERKEWIDTITRCLTDFPEVEPPIRLEIETFKTNWADARKVEA